MNSFVRSVFNTFSGTLKSFRRFPTSVCCALLFAVIAMIRIQLDWQQQKPYDFLLNCLHWALALGAIFSLAVVAAERRRFNRSKTFLSANLLGAAVVIITFFVLYLFSRAENPGNIYNKISSIASARVGIAILVSFIAFVIFAGNSKDRTGFSSSLFMTQKAFLIALLYGVVIMAGVSGVAGAIESLLYNDMSSKVYIYIATISGFLSFTIFAGYFPDLSKDRLDADRERAQKQPRFIEVLFGYIMVPIVLALTVVLLIWAVKTVLSGMDVSFSLLSGIAATYTLGGLWLHAMVIENESRLSLIYRRIYPVASLVILVFEAWAVVIQLGLSGLKTPEYIFILLWVLAAAGALLLLTKKAKAHKVIAIIACALAVFSVLPVVGYNCLPVADQVRRLEKLLTSSQILVNGILTPAASELDRSVREDITDAVLYIARSENNKLPEWFDKNLSQADVFRSKLGFKQTWADIYDEAPNPVEYHGLYRNYSPEAIDVSAYRWAFNLQYDQIVFGTPIKLNGENGLYSIYLSGFSDNTTAPSIKITLGDLVVLESSTQGYIDELISKYPPQQTRLPLITSADLTLRLEGTGINALLVFRFVSVYLNSSGEIESVSLDLQSIYIDELG